MSDYNWQRMAHDLAIKYFGSEEEVEPCGCKWVQVPNMPRMVRSMMCDVHVDSWKNVREWIPESDLNQAWMLFDDDRYYALKWMSSTERFRATQEKGDEVYSALHRKDPAKAIMLAVTKASDLNLTDYEVSDGT